MIKKIIIGVASLPLVLIMLTVAACPGPTSTSPPTCSNPTNNGTFPAFALTAELQPVLLYFPAPERRHD